jgi:ferredoxin
MNRKEFFSRLMIEVLDNPVANTLENLAEAKERPPGAVDEAEFKKICTGCDKCMIACPVNVIMIEDRESRLPIIYPEKDPCIHCDDTPCIAACPTGALILPNESEN